MADGKFDWRVVLVDGAGNVIQVSNPLPVSVGGTITVGSINLDEPVAVTIADGADSALGAKADVAATDDTGTWSLIALFKRLLVKFVTQLPAALTGLGNLKVSLQEVPAGTVLDVGPANTEVVLAASAARTATLITADQTNTLYKGVLIFLRITAAPVSPTGYLRISLQARDPVAITTYLGLNARTDLVHVNGVGGFMWMFYPGSAGEVFIQNFSGMKDVISYPLPKVWRVVVVHSNAESYTYSLSACLMR